MDLTGCCVVQTTIDDVEKAQAIAVALLDAKLAACVQIVAVDSHYVWRGAREQAREFLLSIKARAADFDAIVVKIRALHSYDLPEIIALPIVFGDPAYLDWIAQTTRRNDD